MSRALSPQLIMSAVVNIQNKQGQLIPARAILDTCSTAHFITENFARNLGLPLQPCSIRIGAINSITTTSKHAIELNLFSNQGCFAKTLTFLTVPVIADYVPDKWFPQNSLNIPENMKLADPQFNVPRPVDLLVGAGATLSFFKPGQLDLSKTNHDLILQKTTLGWVIVGSSNNSKQSDNLICHLLELKDLMNKFWHIEDLDALQATPSEHLAIERHYETTTSRDESGRYIVQLPFQENHKVLGDSRSHAIRRLHALERKLQKKCGIGNGIYTSFE